MGRQLEFDGDGVQGDVGYGPGFDGFVDGFHGGGDGGALEGLVHEFFIRTRCRISPLQSSSNRIRRTLHTLLGIRFLQGNEYITLILHKVMQHLLLEQHRSEREYHLFVYDIRILEQVPRR